jgi:hypothetical protein
MRANAHRAHEATGNDAVFGGSVCLSYIPNPARGTDTRERNGAFTHRDSANRAISLNTCWERRDGKYSVTN